VLGLAEPTQAPTQVIQVIYVVATSPASTATLIPTLAPTPTPRFSPSPTRKGARTPTAARATATPVPRMYPAPQLLGPANTTVYTGAAANIVLEWQPISSAGLGENEWYRISISYTGRDGKPIEQIRWSTDREMECRRCAVRRNRSLRIEQRPCQSPEHYTRFYLELDTVFTDPLMCGSFLTHESAALRVKSPEKTTPAGSRRCSVSLL
jgi:hypothetical protein